MELIAPQATPPLDPGFRPAALANRTFRRRAQDTGSPAPLAIAVERSDGTVSVYDTVVMPEDHPLFDLSLTYVERIAKFLLWQRGGWKLTIAGPKAVGDYLKHVYSPTGERAFDYDFMGGVYERPFTVECVPYTDRPAPREQAKALGRHLEGCRIGFDAGASDRKVSAVINGEAVFSEEVDWNPRAQTDPTYHYDEINQALKAAADKMPRVDAIGVSSAGVYINNRAMVASLFRGIPKDRFGEVKELFLRLQREWNVPLEVVNDGEVTALAGSMSLGVNSILGVAMGSSEAAGYVTPDGSITNWLNELAFAPVDYSPDAPVDEWSGDRGVGALYFSQQAIFRLLQPAGIEIDPSLELAARLKAFQYLHNQGDPRTRAVYETIGDYLGYGIAHYADFYDLEHALILGRVTSGDGGAIILERANVVLQREFPELADRLTLHLPDEKSRRVGQSIAAASLPELSI